MTEAPVRDLGAALAGASEAAGEAGLAFRASGAARLRSAKTGGELLTERDLAADRVLRARLSRAFPE